MKVHVSRTEPAQEVENKCLVCDRGAEVEEGVRHGLHPPAILGDE
jgi:hypothetical protein